MKNFKNLLRWFIVISFVLMASIGIGIGGPIPVFEIKKREPDNEAKIEQVDEREDSLQ